MKNNFYITTTLPYTNSDPHIGFAKEIIKADIIARWQKLHKKEIFFNTGTDEHGLKIWEKAQELNMSVNDYCQNYTEKFYNLKEVLNLSFTNFIRTSDKDHQKAAQIFWQRCEENGDIYKKNYKVKYCVGCELEKTDSDLEKGRCPFHPNRELEEINEENYFFRFSKYQDRLLEFYDKNPDFVVPQHRFNEIKNFVKKGLKDFSISRLKDKMPNGVSVPNDKDQVMYVWFDALINYISSLGWPDKLDNFDKFWPGIQVCGKDNLRQQTAMWPAMLFSANIEISKQVLVFGFITIDGQKISKSLGNTIEPSKLVDKYGSDTLRYYLISQISTFEDGDFSLKNLELVYKTDLANVLGNFASRLSNLIEKNQIDLNLSHRSIEDIQLYKEFSILMKNYKLMEAIQYLFKNLRALDEKMTRKAPWKKKEREDLAKILKDLANDFLDVLYLLEIFLPSSSRFIINELEKKSVKKINALFPPLNN